MTSRPLLDTEPDSPIDGQADTEPPAEDLVTESLVEEVSIDGMCGVY